MSRPEELYQDLLLIMELLTNLLSKEFINFSDTGNVCEAWCGLPGKLRSHIEQSWSLWLWGRSGRPSALCARLSSSRDVSASVCATQGSGRTRHAPIQQPEGLVAHAHSPVRGEEMAQRGCATCPRRTASR